MAPRLLIGMAYRKASMQWFERIASGGQGAAAART
jgi:hypothetical protein